MSHPINDKAEVSIDFPDKFYMGSFSRESRFDLTADDHGIHLHLDRPGPEKRHVGFHIHYHLLTDVLDAMSEAIAKAPALEPHIKAALHEASAKLAKSTSK